MRNKRTNRRYWYHVTDTKHWGESIILNPRIPVRLGEDEPQIERICVAPTVAQCISAVRPEESFLCIYRTATPVSAYWPNGVSDYRITQEKWLLRPTRFVNVGYIDDYITNALYSIFSKLGYACGDKTNLHKQKNILNDYKRFLANHFPKIQKKPICHYF